MANYKSGMKMQMGSKQKNTPSNFSGSAFKMITGEEPSSDFFENIDPMNSLGQNTTDDMNEQFDEMKAGYQPPIELVSKDTSGSPEAYASLGKGLRNLIKPKPGTLIFFPAYVPHQFTVDEGSEPFRFIHFNLQAVRKIIVGE